MTDVAVPREGKAKICKHDVSQLVQVNMFLLQLVNHERICILPKRVPEFLPGAACEWQLSKYHKEQVTSSMGRLNYPQPDSSPSLEHV